MPRGSVGTPSLKREKGAASPLPRTALHTSCLPKRPERPRPRRKREVITMNCDGDFSRGIPFMYSVDRVHDGRVTDPNCPPTNHLYPQNVYHEGLQQPHHFHGSYHNAAEPGRALTGGARHHDGSHTARQVRPRFGTGWDGGDDQHGGEQCLFGREGWQHGPFDHQEKQRHYRDQQRQRHDPQGRQHQEQLHGRHQDDQRHRSRQHHDRQQDGQHQRRQQQQQQQQQHGSRPALHTTGGRPWTIYALPQETGRRKKPPRVSTAGKGIGIEEHQARRRRGEQITVVSYNVLADSLVSFEYIPYCRSWPDAAWKARPKRTLEKMLDFDPDVICLQEVDEDQYTTVYKESLEPLGYVGAYFRRGGSKKDGCATFVRTARLRLAEEKGVAYKKQGHPLLDRDNVALLTAVDVLPAHQGASSVKATGPAADNGDNFAGKSKEDSKESDDDESPYQKEPRVSESSPDAGVSRVPTPILDEDGDGEADKGGPSEGSAVPIARLVIANTHLLFNPKRGDIKMAQLMMLTASVESMAQNSKADGVIITGDFNMTPGSALYHYMVKGELNVDGMNRCVASGQCGVVNRQRLDQVKEIDNCGALPHRVAGVKHQGGGCALGSFLHPSIAATGKRAKWEMKGRSGAVYGGPEQPATAPCDRCARRPPQGAVSRYVMHDSGEANADADFPPGAPHGSTFVLMDPAPPCRCAMGRANDGDSRTGNKSQRGSDVHRNLETYNPPLLWPSNGDKMARTSGQGPVKHRLRLRSSYSQQADAWGSGEPAFTSYHHLFKGTVDYVFYGSHPRQGDSSPASGTGASFIDSMATAGSSGDGAEECLRCVGVAEPPMRSDLDRFGGLPSPAEPSDHILLAVRFDVRSRILS